MKVNLIDVYGQPITLLNATAVFTSNMNDNTLCVKILNEKKERRYNISALNYWEVIQ